MELYWDSALNIQSEINRGRSRVDGGGCMFTVGSMAVASVTQCPTVPPCVWGEERPDPCPRGGPGALTRPRPGWSRPPPRVMSAQQPSRAGCVVLCCAAPHQCDGISRVIERRRRLWHSWQVMGSRRAGHGPGRGREGRQRQTESTERDRETTQPTCRAGLDDPGPSDAVRRHCIRSGQHGVLLTHGAGRRRAQGNPSAVA